MARHKRPYRIITLLPLSLLVLAPVQAEATSHSLAQLCAKILTCGPVLGTVPPKITKADSTITPGGYVVVQGSGFGQEPGELYITELWTHPVGDSLAGVTGVKLTIPKAPPGWDFWTPTQVIGQVPDNITQVRDQQVKLRIKTKDNKWSNEYTPVKFVARRDKVFIPSSDPAVTVASCSDDANWNSCGTGPCLFPATLCASHENCWACVGDDSGTDTFHITLKTDWVFTSNSIHVEVSADGEGSASALPGLKIAPNVWRQSVSWSVTPDDWVEYFVGVFITGPIGVPWK